MARTPSHTALDVLLHHHWKRENWKLPSTLKSQDANTQVQKTNKAGERERQREKEGKKCLYCTLHLKNKDSYLTSRNWRLKTKHAIHTYHLFIRNTWTDVRKYGGEERRNITHQEPREFSKHKDDDCWRRRECQERQINKKLPVLRICQSDESLTFISCSLTGQLGGKKERIDLYQTIIWWKYARIRCQWRLIIHIHLSPSPSSISLSLNKHYHKFG